MRVTYGDAKYLEFLIHGSCTTGPEPDERLLEVLAKPPLTQPIVLRHSGEVVCKIKFNSLD